MVIASKQSKLVICGITERVQDWTPVFCTSMQKIKRIFEKGKGSNKTIPWLVSFRCSRQPTEIPPFHSWVSRTLAFLDWSVCLAKRCILLLINGQLKGDKVFCRQCFCFFFFLIPLHPSLTPPWHNISFRRGYLASIFCFAFTVDHFHRDLSETSKLQKGIPAKSKHGLTG